MIDFKSKNFVTCNTLESDDSVVQQLNLYTLQIKDNIGSVKDNYIKLGASLISLWFSDSYRVFAKDHRDLIAAYKPPIGYSNVCSTVFFAYIDIYCHISRSTASRCMNIVSEFCNGDVLKDQYKDFSYSQLIELLPLSAESRKLINPNWSIHDIRLYKKSLRSRNDSTIKETSRFLGWSRNDLIEHIEDLEIEKRNYLQVIDDLQRKLDEYEDNCNVQSESSSKFQSADFS